MSDEKTGQHKSMPRLRKFMQVIEDHERVLNIINTTMTAIFTVVLATSTLFLWKETRDLRKFAEDQSER
jgi:Na+/phosphate symporter